MMLFMYVLAPILGFALLGGIIKFKLYKKSVSTSVIVASYTIAATLFYFGMQGLALFLITASVITLYFRALGREDNDTFTTNRFTGKERRNVRFN